MDGRPRQRVVRYLGAIREGRLVYPLSTDRFWRDVDAALAEVQLDDEQRDAIEAGLAATVPRPDPAVVEQKRLELNAWAAAGACLVGG